MCTGSKAFCAALCGLALFCALPAPALTDPQYDSVAGLEEGAGGAGGAGGWDALGSLYALLAQHDALGGHALARKSVRSPSRRLRFGRRSDPEMPPQPPMDELEELEVLREARTPVRLRFGRRADETVMAHVFPNDEQDRFARAPSMRLRFGRRADPDLYQTGFEKAETKTQSRTQK